MTIADDIKEVLAEVGTSLTLHNPDGSTVTNLHVDPSAYPDQSTLFVRMFQQLGSLAADTPVGNGSIVEYGGIFYIVTNFVPTMFENAVVENIVVFYRCNTTVDIFTHNDAPGYDASYNKLPEWTPTATTLRACFVEKRLLESPEIEASVYSTGNVTNVLYIPAVNPVKRGDRITTPDGVNYKIEHVSRYELDGVQVCGVGEDNR